MPREQVLATVLRDEFAHPDQQRNWLAITIAATNPSHPAHDFFIARREKMRDHFTSTRLATTQDSEELSADDKVTMVMAMMDGLRIQSLLDPGRKRVRAEDCSFWQSRWSADHDIGRWHSERHRRAGHGVR